MRFERHVFSEGGHPAPMRDAVREDDEGPKMTQDSWGREERADWRRYI